jgi:hypothetical protein
MSKLGDAALEDLAIQDTLSMTTEERLDLLANLIAEKIIKKLQPSDEPCSTDAKEPTL